MPFVNVKVIKGVFSTAQKKELMKGVTDAIVAVRGENLRQLTVVVIDEVKSGEWAVGGQPLTTAQVQALAARPVKQR